MAETGKSFAGYRKLLQASRPAVLAKSRASPDYPASVARAWQVSIEAAEAAYAGARPLLELLAFFAPEALPAELLAADKNALPLELRGELERDEAIGALNRLSLITAEAGTIAIHRLVQAVTRDGLDAEAARARAEAAIRLVQAALPRPSREHTNWPAIGILLPHTLVTAEAAEQLGADLKTAATVLIAVALYHKARAAWAEAEPLLLRAIAIVKKAFGPEHPDLATGLNNLAMLYEDTGRYAEAEPLLLRAIAIVKKARGPEHPNLATGLNNLAMLYEDARRYAEAKPLLLRAIAIGEKAFSPEHPDLATRLNNLANLYLKTGRYAEAEPLLLRAIAIIEKALGSEHPTLAAGLSSLGGLYWETGRYAEAEPLWRRAFTILDKALPADHPSLVHFCRSSCVRVV
jgi:tetratricopeptide (TPR) repeat protein